MLISTIQKKCVCYLYNIYNIDMFSNYR